MSNKINICTFTVFLQFLLIQCLANTDLSAYLTLNKSHNWLRNQTEKSHSTNPYCLICCMNIKENSIGKICGKHTMCVYEDRPGPTCKGFISIRFTKDEITAIVDIHNTIRNWVAMGLETKGGPGPQPSAANMRMVEWDDELALLAARWAAQCVFAHDLCRDLSTYPVGQNIAKGNYALKNDLSFIVDWYNTVELFGYDEISNYQLKYQKSYPSPSQYTQLVWAETFKIGCARVAFQRSDGSNLSYREHFICNYGPAGNIPQQSVYKIGEPCSECPTGTGCGIEYPALCSSETTYEMSYKVHPRRKLDKHSTNSCKGIDRELAMYLLLLFWVFLILY